MPSSGHQRRARQRKIKLDADAYVESDEKPPFLRRSPRTRSQALNPQAESYEPHHSHGCHLRQMPKVRASPPGYDPNEPILAAVAEIQSIDKSTVLVPFLAKGDLSVAQLKGTLRFQLGLDRSIVDDAELELHQQTMQSVSTTLVREDNVEDALRKLALFDAASYIKISA